MAERRISISVCGQEQLQADLRLLADAAERSPQVREALVRLFSEAGACRVAGVDIWRRHSADAGVLCIDLVLTPALAALVACLRLAQPERNDPKPETAHEAAPPTVASVSLDLLADGRVRISSTCGGRPDARYAPMLDAKVPLEVQKLLAECRAATCSPLGAGVESVKRGLPAGSVVVLAIEKRESLLRRSEGWSFLHGLTHLPFRLARGVQTLGLQIGRCLEGRQMPLIKLNTPEDAAEMLARAAKKPSTDPLSGRTAKVVLVTFLRGEGNLSREVLQVFSEAGDLLAEHDGIHADPVYASYFLRARASQEMLSIWAGEATTPRTGA